MKIESESQGGWLETRGFVDPKFVYGRLYQGDDDPAVFVEDEGRIFFFFSWLYGCEILEKDNAKVFESLYAARAGKPGGGSNWDQLLDILEEELADEEPMLCANCENTVSALEELFCEQCKSEFGSRR